MKRIMSMTIALLSAIVVFAQGEENMPLPNDPAVKTGKLDNGMTYYIRHNDLPAGRCEFYLATNVGAIQEAPDQDGLAHFLEHMCFNGLKNLPGKQMLDYLQSIGAEFGRNINASTGVEHTQYMLNNIPVSREGILDTCLLVMHDYSHFVLNDPSEIDAERGVILEEKRTRNTAGWRMFEQSAPYMYGKTSKYATCTIIGSEDNLKNFKPESLTNFYKTWYQPDMQAIIVVGDIDVEQVYGKIVKLFSDIPAPAKKTIKTMPSVVFNTQPVAAILKDPEITETSVEFYWKTGIPRSKTERGTLVGYYDSLVKNIISQVFNERLSDIASKADSPFLSAFISIGDLCETCEVLNGWLSCENARTVDASRAILTEVERVIRYGFTTDELDRAKENILKRLRDRVAGAATRKNPEFVRPLISNFFSGYPYMTPETEYAIVKGILSQLSVEIINEEIGEYIPDNPPTIIYMGVDKPGQVHPTEKELTDLVDEVFNADIERPVEKEISKDLMQGNAPEAVAVKKESKGDYGSTVWEFANGLKVVVLPTQYKKDQVLLSVRKYGGLSLIPTEDIASFNVNLVSTFNGNSGISDFPKTTLDKMLTGKAVSLNISFENIYTGINGQCNPEDLETQLQLMNLAITAPRFDSEEWDLGIKEYNAILPNLVSNPEYIFSSHMSKNIYDSPRKSIISPEVVQKANLSTYEKYYRMLLSDLTGATAYIVGNVDIETLKPLVEQYLGSIPGAKKASTWNKKNIVTPLKGENVDVFQAKMETPKASVMQVYSASVPYSLQKDVNLDAASFILDMIYVATLREQEGGTYGASSQFSISYQPTELAMLQVYFDTNIQQQESLRGLAVDGVKTLATQGPTAEQLTSAIENAKKNLPEKRITNNYWIAAMKYNQIRGGDYDAEYEKAISNITADGIKAAVSEIIGAGNFRETVMLPQ